MSEDQKMCVKRPKDPSEYGERKYTVELFITERFTVTTYADTEDVAVRRSKVSVFRGNNGLMGFKCQGGVSTAHYDEDFNFQVVKGDVVDDTEEDC